MTLGHGNPVHQTTIIPPGKPRFIELTPQEKHLIIQTNPISAVTLHRHYDPQKPGTTLCQCDPVCESHREDTFVSALEWIGPLTWEQRLWCISEQALAELWRFVKMKTGSLEWRGVELGARRTGLTRNARVCLTWRMVHTSVPEGFNVPWAVLKSTGIATDFFGRVSVVPEVPNGDQVIPPARSRSDKPRVQLGRPHRK